MSCLDLIIDDGTTVINIPYNDCSNFNYSFPQIQVLKTLSGNSVSQQSCGDGASQGKTITFSGKSLSEQPFAALIRSVPWTIHCIRPLPGHPHPGRPGKLDHPIIQVRNISMALNGEAKSSSDGGLQFSFTCVEV